MTQNRIEIEGSIAALESIRYTPAGIPIVELKLTHASEQIEAGKPRQVALELTALAAGELARQLSRAPLGAYIKAVGFLAHPAKAQVRLVLHLTEFEYVQNASQINQS